MNRLFEEALGAAVRACPTELLKPLTGARIVITGATGFFGGWVLRAISYLNGKTLAIQGQCISRSPESFLKSNPDLIDLRGLSWLTGDVLDLARLPIDSSTTHILHMAASSDARQNHADPLKVAATILQGTLGCIEWSRRTGAHLHFVSSGAVYGARRKSDGPSGESQVQRYAPDPLNPAHAYGNAKRMAESLLAGALDNFSISRPFAFLGPLLPLDKHFAAGNFIADAVAGRPIRILGDGSPLRSYMHPADLAIWLLALLAQGPRREPVNIGSDQPIAIGDLASEISRLAGSPRPTFAKAALPDEDPAAYWPDTSKARSMGLCLSLPLQDCIQHSLAWARSPIIGAIQISQ